MFKTLLAILLLAIASVPAAGVELPALYTAEVPLDPDADDPRALAYRSALEAVLLRVSGSELVADIDRVELLFPNPAAYVVQFRPGEEDTLWVSFDGEAIERTLRTAGQTFWGSDRPLTLVWLAVDWGQGEREIIGADDPERSLDEARSIDRNRLLRERVLDASRRRGLPVVFPLLDVEDLQKVTFSDIWGGFDDALLDASQRYDVNSILIGRVRPGTAEQNRWGYYFGGEQRNWGGEPELVVSLIADVLAQEFAISGNAPLVSVELSISGIDSVTAYGEVQAMLAEIPVVEGFVITEVVGDLVHYRVDVLGGAERLSRALRFGGLIEQNGFNNDRPPFGSRDAGLEFFYSHR